MGFSLFLGPLLIVFLLAGGFPAGLQPRVEAATAKVTVQPGEVIPLATVAVQGSGFPEDARGRLTWTDTGESLKSLRTDDRGRFATTVRVPEVATGRYEIVAKVGRTTRRTTVQVARWDGAPVALGVFQPGAPGDASLDRIETLIGRTPEIVMWYQHWGLESTRDLQLEQLRAVAARGAVPMITWEPWDPRDGRRQQPRYHLRNLCAVTDAQTNDEQLANNRYIDEWAARLEEYGAPVLLRFAHEMNGDWYPWTADVNDNTAKDYVDAWACVRERFKGVANVEWVWSPNIRYNEQSRFEPFYPGDRQVDWLALDGYNWGGSSADWQFFQEVFGSSLQDLADLPQGSGPKPVMIAESASAEGGGKAAWIRAAMFKNLPLDYPQIRAIVWFNQKKERDWRFSSSDSARAAFRAAANHPYYRGDLSP